MDIAALIQAGRQAEVIAALEPRSAAGDPSASNNLALAYRWMGNNALEVAYAQRAFQQDPSSIQGVNTLFRALRSAGHFQILTAVYGAFPSKHRLDRHHFLIAALAYLEINRVAAAEAALAHLPDFPRNETIELEIALQLATGASDHEAAFECLDRLTGIGAKTGAQRFRQMFAMGDMARALDDFKANWRSDPEVAAASKTAMLCAMALDDRDLVVQLRPGMPPGMQSFVDTYLDHVDSVRVAGAARTYEFPFDAGNFSISMPHASGDFYEATALQRLSALLQPGDQVVDVGANIGNHTIYFAGERGCRVLPFECNPTLVPKLRKAIEGAGLGDLVDMSRLGAAVSDVVGEVYFNFMRADYSNVAKTPSGAAPAVPSVTLDSLDLTSCRLLKVDVDGGELGVLRGAEGFLQKHRPVLALEVMNSNTVEALSFLERVGYAQIREDRPLRTHSDFIFAPIDLPLPAI